MVFGLAKKKKSIDVIVINLEEEFSRFDITFEIDKILNYEGYEIDFHNYCMYGYDDVTYYDIGDKYRIELYGIEESKKFTLTFILKEINTFKDLWELEYLRSIYEKIIEAISGFLVKEKEDD